MNKRSYNFKTDKIDEDIVLSVKQKIKHDLKILYNDNYESCSYVFAIKCTINNRMYICTANAFYMGQKFRDSLNKCKNGTYSNILMQHDYDTYGRECFTVDILGKDTDEGWEKTKQKYIDMYGGIGSSKLYNITNTRHRHVSYFNSISDELRRINEL